MVLKHHRAVGAGFIDLAFLEQDAARVDRTRPATMLSNVDLPQPE